MRLKDTVAIITGAATGIGQGIAERFANEGAAVVVDYVGKPDTPRKTEDAIRGAGGRTIAVEADVSDPDQLQNLIQSAVREFNIGSGAIYTPIDADLEAKPELEKAPMSEIPLNRWGQPSDVVGLAVYLASDEAVYVTGATYFIDGGMLRQADSY